MIRAVVFDLDDTLYAEKDYVQSGLKAVADYIEKKGFRNPYDQFTALKKTDFKNIFDRFLNSGDLPFTVKDLHEIYINHWPAIHLYDDVLPCLKSLKSKHMKLGMITDGRVIQQRNKVQALGIENFFEYIIYSDELGVEYRKPHPKPFEVMREKLDIEFSEMIYVGDNPAKDFAVKKIFPIKTCEIMRESKIYKNCAYCEGIMPDCKINGLKKICDCLTSIGA